MTSLIYGERQNGLPFFFKYEYKQYEWGGALESF